MLLLADEMASTINYQVLKMKNFLRAKACAPLAIKSLLPKFETADACNREKQLRIKALSRSRLIKAQELTEILSDCEDDKPCLSFACPECVRLLRVKKISQLALFCEDYTEWKVATFIYYDEMVRDLMDLDIGRLKERLRKQLQRSGVTNIVIGFLEMDHHTEYQRWLPHYHLLVRCQNSHSPEWEALRRFFKEQQIPSNVHIRTRRPVLFQDLKDPVEQVAYICKVMWQEVESYYDAKDRRRTKKYRLSNSNFVAAVLKLGPLKLSDLEFRHKVRQFGATLKESVRGKK
jgi:hypothetical protein